MPVTSQPQTSLYETTIEDVELERLLEAREAKREARTAAQGEFKEADEAAKGRLSALDIADAPVRVGRFVVSRRSVKAREVSFSTSPTSRLVINRLPDDLF